MFLYIVSVGCWCFVIAFRKDGTKFPKMCTWIKKNLKIVIIFWPFLLIVLIDAIEIIYTIFEEGTFVNSALIPVNLLICEILYRYVTIYIDTVGVKIKIRQLTLYYHPPLLFSLNCALKQLHNKQKNKEQLLWL